MTDNNNYFNANTSYSGYVQGLFVGKDPSKPYIRFNLSRKNNSDKAPKPFTSIPFVAFGETARELIASLKAQDYVEIHKSWPNNEDIRLDGQPIQTEGGYPIERVVFVVKEFVNKGGKKDGEQSSGNQQQTAAPQQAPAQQAAPAAPAPQAAPAAPAAPAPQQGDDSQYDDDIPF